MLTRRLGQDFADRTIGTTGRTPLSWAAGEGQYDTMALRLRPRNTRPNKADKDCQTPLSWLPAMSMIEWWGSSRSWARPKIEAKHQSGGLHQTSILMVASLRLRRGDASPNSSDAHNQTPFFWAARMGPVEVLLRHRDVNPNAQDSPDPGFVGR